MSKGTQMTENRKKVKTAEGMKPGEKFQLIDEGVHLVLNIRAIVDDEQVVYRWRKSDERLWTYSVGNFDWFRNLISHEALFEY